MDVFIEVMGYIVLSCLTLLVVGGTTFFLYMIIKWMVSCD